MSINPFDVLNSLSPSAEAPIGDTAAGQSVQNTQRNHAIEQTSLPATAPLQRKQSGNSETKFQQPQKSVGKRVRPANIVVTPAAAPYVMSPADFPGLGPATPVLPMPKAPKMIFPGSNKPIKSAPSKGPKVALPQPKVIEHETVIEIWAQKAGNAPEEVDKAYPLNRLIARSKYFATKYAGEPLTYTGMQPVLKETLHASPIALKCVLGMLKSWPLELPVGSRSRPQVIFDRGRCHCSDMSGGIDYLHYAQLYQATEVLSLTGVYEEQFSVRNALIKYCQEDRLDERLVAILNSCWINKVFAHSLLHEIIGTLENLDGATDDTRFAGPRQNSFSAYVAGISADLDANYMDARTKWAQKLINKKRWAKREQAKKTSDQPKTGQQSAQQSSSNNQPLRKNGLQKKGSQQSFQQPSSKIGTIKPEDAEKYYGKRGMGGS